MNNDSSAETAATDDELLSKLVSAVAELDFVDLDARKKSFVAAKEVAQYDAFRRTFKGEAEPTFLVKSSWMKELFPKDRSRLCELCVARGIMTQGRAPDTHTHQEKIGGKPIEVYRIKMLQAQALDAGRVVRPAMTRPPVRRPLGPHKLMRTKVPVVPRKPVKQRADW